jgi:hypothetical protein
MAIKITIELHDPGAERMTESGYLARLIEIRDQHSEYRRRQALDDQFSPIFKGVTVNEAVPHPSYRTPLNLRTRCAELLSQILHGLADNFQAAHKGTPQCLIRRETLEAPDLHSD